MAYEDKIYDITALEMAKRLEVFLGSCNLGVSGFNDRIEEFCRQHNINDDLKCHMNSICKWRNKIVHPKNSDTLVKFCPHPVQVLDLEEFKEFQRSCFLIDENINKDFGKDIRMKEIMIPTLKYTMGNVGDIIKHGLLAEFVEWWQENHPNQILQVADTFGGSPWGNLSDKIAKRLRSKESALFRSYSTSQDKYLGSGHLIRQVAKSCKLKVHIDISDKDENARCNLENSILGNDYERGDYIMKLITLPSGNDGYQILNEDQNPAQYNLILIDPYGEFLRDEFYRTENPKCCDKSIKYNTEYFQEIIKLVDAYPNLFVAVFVLDKDETNSVGEAFASFKKGELNKHAVSLRCPKMDEENTDKVKGESTFDSEILLIGKQIHEKKCDKLHERLKSFAEHATRALPLKNNKSNGTKVKFWCGE